MPVYSLKKGYVGTTPIGCEIYTVAVTQAHEELGFFNIANNFCLAPSIKGWTKLTSEVTQKYEFGAR